MPTRDVFDRRRRRLVAIAGTIALVSSRDPRRVLAQVTPGANMRIGIIGSGRIGGTLGGLWVKTRHPVFFSSRHPEESKEMVAKLGPLAQAGSVERAIVFGDAVLVAVPYGALPTIGQDNRSALGGKIVLDACNAVESRDGGITSEVERNGIGGTSQKYLPGAGLVRPSTRFRT